MPGEQLKTKKQKYKEFVKIYNRYPVATIMRKLNLKRQSEFDEFVEMAFQDGIIVPDKIMSISNSMQPLSYNENDYGSIPSITRVSKKGYKTYKNNPTKEAKPTKIKRAASIYKQMLKDNNLWKKSMCHLAIG